MIQSNRTFINSTPIWANACVGNNGFSSYWEYAKGFSQAAIIIIDLVLINRGIKHSVDNLVYPVCFNMRHSVELRLKGAISELILIEKNRLRKLQFDSNGSHDIGNIWEFFTKNALIADDRFYSIISRLDKKIKDIADVDATGQTFRYPLDTQSRKHLADVANINFANLKLRFTELESDLDELHRLNIHLRDEYELGTFTKRLSRKNLFEIAYLLPPRTKWKEESFAIAKESIKKRFNISNNEFSKSIKLIEANYELAAIINVLIPLWGVEEEYIDKFFATWLKYHNLSSNQTPIDIEVFECSSDDMLKFFANDFKMHDAVWEITKSDLSPEKLAGISALFYFERELDFSEKYTLIYKSELKEVNNFSENSEMIKSKYFHILDKTNVIYNILHSLYFLGKIEFAERLIEIHNLGIKFSWLDEARRRAAFWKPDYCK